MTMHLARGLTTISTKKRKTKITKAMQAEFERGWRDRNQRLKEIHLPKETFEQYMEWLHGTGRKTKKETQPNSKPSKAITIACLESPQSSASRFVARNQPSTDEGKVQSEDIKSKVSVSRPSHWVTGPCSSKPSPTYTGTKMIGIGTMHKSNAVPIFSDDEAKEISSMRR